MAIGSQSLDRVAGWWRKRCFERPLIGVRRGAHALREATPMLELRPASTRSSVILLVRRGLCATAKSRPGRVAYQVPATAFSSLIRGALRDLGGTPNHRTSPSKAVTAFDWVCPLFLRTTASSDSSPEGRRNGATPTALARCPSRLACGTRYGARVSHPLGLPCRS